MLSLSNSVKVLSLLTISRDEVLGTGLELAIPSCASFSEDVAHFINSHAASLFLELLEIPKPHVQAAVDCSSPAG